VTASLFGKVALITGGTSGIGEAGARLFSEAGASVVIASPQVDRGRQLVNELRRGDRADALFVATDVTQPSQVMELVDTTVKHFGRLDIIWANAGISSPGTAPETSEETWAQIIAVNLSGPFYTAKYGIPALVQSGGGSIVLTASELGLIGAHSFVAYCAAKGGVINMTRALANDCAPYKIRVNCVAPGPIRTPMLIEHFGKALDPSAEESRTARATLLGRLGQPEEIAKAALFLASDDSSYMTGSIQVVDGGVTCWNTF
jgi:NAD(P)-dependent dehydrogenase (short-subunit alcohol dehydrogenase family)